MSLIVLGTAILLFLSLFLRKIGQREHGLPPGPPTLPIIGNLKDIIPPKLYLRAETWASTYGEIFSLKVFSQTMVVLSSPTAILEILDKKGSATADRMPMMSWDLVSDANYLIFMRSGPQTNLTNIRKAAQVLMSRQGIEKRHKVQSGEILVLLGDLLESPENFYDHIYRTALASVLSQVYGPSERCTSHSSPIVSQLQSYVRQMAHFVKPQNVRPIDFLPFLRHVPDNWAWWKRDITNLRTVQRDLFMRLLERCEERMASEDGHREGSYMEDIVDRREEFGFKTRDQLAYHAAALLDAGTDTTSGFLRTVVLMLTAFPECQRKAKEEVDRVVGPGRIPRLEDIESMPYVRAFISEIHRFRPTTPLGVPHAATQDLSYNGYTIPKGSLIQMNLWSIFHNPEYFEEPNSFKPERFIMTEHGTKIGVDTTGFRSTLSFGAGRRICPGMNMANDSIALGVMSFLWAFDFQPQKDSTTGQEIPLDLNNFEETISDMPLPFACSITPRSQYRSNIIRKEVSTLFPDGHRPATQ